jgi:RNA polymerase sigma-70 factor (ECF subfamily)
VASDEKKWLQKARLGDDVAFGHLVQAYQVPVFNLCYRILGDDAEAEDAAQETFLRAYRHLRRYDPQRSFTTWLLSIASHHCIDRLRRRRMILLSLEELMPGQRVASNAPGPEAVVIDREREEQVQQLLQTLEAKDRAAVVLRYWHNLSYVEIAETLSMTVSAVKSRLHRARKGLAQAWAKKPQVAWAE